MKRVNFRIISQGVFTDNFEIEILVWLTIIGNRLEIIDAAIIFNVQIVRTWSMNSEKVKQTRKSN